MLDIEVIEKQIESLSNQIEALNTEYDIALVTYLDPIQKRAKQLEYKLDTIMNDYLNSRYPGGQWENCQTCALGSLNLKVRYFNDLWYNEGTFDSMSEGHSNIETLLESVVAGFPIKIKNAFWETLLTRAP